MTKLKDFLTESNKPKMLNEIFIQFGEITKSPSGKVRDSQIARLAMIAEMDAANLYEAMISQTSNKDLKTLLQDISNEEKVHAGEFEYILSEIDPEWEDLEDEGEEEAEEKTGGK
jgi:rubrerythrin